MNNLTELFCLTDDFCQGFERERDKQLQTDGKQKRSRSASLSLSELMTLAGLLHPLRYRQFKRFYRSHALRFPWSRFCELRRYHRCVDLMQRCDVRLPGNVDRRKFIAFLCRKLFGKSYVVNEYVARWLAGLLHTCQMDLTANARKNMKRVPHTPFDPALLQRRSLIATVPGELEIFSRVGHTHHRPHATFIVNLMSGTVACCVMPNEPRLSRASSAIACPNPSSRTQVVYEMSAA